jgi:hypothetical protein
MEPMYLTVERQSGDTFRESDPEDPGRGPTCIVFQTEETARWSMGVVGDGVTTLALEPDDLARRLAEDAEVTHVVYWYGFPMDAVFGRTLGGYQVKSKGEFLEFLARVEE